MTNGIGHPLVYCRVHEDMNYPGVWHVTTIVHYGSGRSPRIWGYLFSGPGARERAHAFALAREACALTFESGS
jgi:hypothetical protein